MFTEALFIINKTKKQPKCPQQMTRQRRYVHTHTHTHIYTQWNITQPWKEWNKAAFNNMDGTRDYHTKWSKSDKPNHILSPLFGIWKT